MAITKIFPIKKTLHKAIKYIANPQKTDKGALVSTYQCGIYTADLEMEIIAKQGKGAEKKNNRKAYHIIQSFAKDDPVTPEEALKIGRQLAWKYTGGNHQFIVATHIDKGHIHNHIIFNATDYTSYGKIHIQNKNLDRLRDISDRLCEENGLSVIEEKSGIKGRGKYEHEQHQNGSSWKDKLRDSIDRTILAAEDFDDFITRMEMEEGYEIKTGKYISFRSEGQERFTRNKRLGENYSIEAICARIENKEIASQRREPKQTNAGKGASSRKKKTVPQGAGHIYLIEKIDRKLALLEPEKPEAYRNALIKNEINSLVQSKEFLIRNGLDTEEKFWKQYSSIASEFDKTAKNQSGTKREILSLEIEMKQLQNYREGIDAYKEFHSTRNKLDFVKDEKKYIQKINYEAAKKYFDKIIKKDPDQISMDELSQRLEHLKNLADTYPAKREALFQSKKKLEIIASNMKTSLGIDLIGKGDSSHGREDSTIKKEEISI